MLEIIIFIFKVLWIAFLVMLCVALPVLLWFWNHFYKLNEFIIFSGTHWFTFDEIRDETKVPTFLIHTFLLSQEKEGNLKKRCNEQKTESLLFEEKELLKTAELTLENIEYFEFQVVITNRRKQKRIDLKNFVKIPGLASA